MSLKLVGVVALAGLSAVAAYLFLFRKKEEETIDEEIAEQIKQVPKTTDKVEDGLQEIEASASPTVEKEITQIGSIEDISPQPVAPATEVHRAETEGEDLTSKTESLMEWIDRQLKEAESKSRNATPAPESQIIRNASPDLNKNETDNTLITPEKGSSEESFTSEIKLTKTNPDEDNFTAIEETKDLVQSQMDHTFVTEKHVDSEESLASEKQETKINLDEDNFTTIEETKDLNKNETQNTLVTPEKGDISEESLASELKPTTTNPDVKYRIEETKVLDDNTVVTPDEDDVSEESLASEIEETKAGLDEDNFTSIEETNVIEDKDDSLDSIEIIEMTEVENVPTEEETVNANQQNESEETVEPQPNKDDWNEKCTQEENKSIKIIDMKINSEEDRGVEDRNPVQPSAAIFSDSADSLNYQENVSYIESINISIADNSADNLIPNICDDNNTSAQTENDNSISAETDCKVNDEEDSSAVNILGDVKISEVSPDKNGLAVHAESADSISDLAKNTKIESESLRDAECNMTLLVDEDSDTEIQLLKESSEKKNAILEDSDSSGNDSDSGSCAESVNTEVTVDEAKSDDSEKELIGNGENSKEELNDSIGLMLRPSWQIKKPQKTLSGMDAKLTSI